MPVADSGKRDQKTRVGDSFHRVAKPFLVEKSRGPPRMIPARRMNFFGA
jgi:hypothetical protein